MYGKKFYKEYVGARGLDSVRIIELDRILAQFYFGTDYPQPKVGFYLGEYDKYGKYIFMFVLITGEIEYDSAGRPESIEYAFEPSSGNDLKFNRFYFNNPYGARIYLFDR